jgi:hypothetical protein
VPSVLATLVAVAAAAVLLRVALGRLVISEELLTTDRVDVLKGAGTELDELGRTLRRVRPPAPGDRS